MSIKEKKLEKIVLKIHHSHLDKSRLGQFKKRLLILYHEMVRDDVMIRAESLSYFSMFSIMPIVAGLFLLLSAVSQWAPVQKDFEDLIRTSLAPLPEDHRNNLMSFIFEFKNSYLKNVAETGSSLGVFALVVLVIVWAKVYFNVEDLMNRIWSVNQDRNILERVRNFTLAMVIIPISILAALSVPGLVQRYGGGYAGVLVDKILPAVLLLGGLFFIFRYYPNVHVRWKNAFKGALLSGVLFAIGNEVLKIYFKFGTQTAYGKMAVLPLFAFFIYVSWIIVMMGAEWSFILQNEKNFTDDLLDSPNLGQAALLLSVIHLCKKQYLQGSKPLSEAEIETKLKVSPRPLADVLDFLVSQQMLVRSQQESRRDDFVYSFSYDPEKIDLRKTVKDYLKISQIDQRFDTKPIIQLISEK